MIFQPVSDLQPSRRAFTLVEMLIVIAIVSILLLSSIAMLRGFGVQARKSGTDMIHAMIDQARTTAITTRSDVILAIAEPGDLPTGDQRCRLGLFRVVDWPESDSDPIPAVLMSRWKFFETGVALIPGEVDGIPNPLDSAELTVDFGARRGPVKVHALAINPRGRLRYPAGSNPVALRLAEGVYRNGVPVPNGAAGNGKVVENRIKIGRVSARPYRFDG